MANFDLSKYEEIEPPKLAARQSIDYSPEAMKQRLFEGIRQRLNFLGDVGGGVREDLQNTGAYLTSSNALPEWAHIPKYYQQPHTEYGRLPIEAAKIITSLAPGFAAEKAAIAVAGLIPRIPGALARVAGGAAGGAAAAPGLDSSPLTGAAIGGSFAAAPELLMQGIGKFLGRNVTPEQFEAARAAVPEGIKAPIGELAKSPRAKNIYSATKAVPFSGAKKPYEQMYNHLTEGLNTLTKDAPEVSKASEYVYSDMKNAYEALKDKTKNAYDEFTKYADKSKIPFDSSKFKSAIDNSIDTLEKKITNPQIAERYSKILSVLKNYKEDPIKTFSSANTLRQELNNEIEQWPFSDKQGLKSLMQMKEGINDAMKANAVNDVKAFNLHKAANDARIAQGEFESLNLRDKSPFYNIYRKDDEPDKLIGLYLKPSSRGSDNSGLLSALTDKLSPSALKVVGKQYLSPKGDESLALQLSALSKLSPTQRALLFPENVQLANDINKLSSIYSGAKAADFTPQTGFTGAKALQVKGLLEHALTGSGVVSATGHPAPLIAALSSIAGAKGLQHLLRSNALKNAYSTVLRAPKGSAITKAGKTERLARALATRAAGGNDNGS